MKTHHSDNQSELTKWLLVVALLCSLLACLGGDISSQNGLSIRAKTELALATKPTVNQAQPVPGRQRSSKFCTPNKPSHFTALRVYNERVTLQLKLVRLTNFTFKRFAHFSPAKTIPASADGPFSGSLRG